MEEEFVVPKLTHIRNANLVINHFKSNFYLKNKSLTDFSISDEGNFAGKVAADAFYEYLQNRIDEGTFKLAEDVSDTPIYVIQGKYTLMKIDIYHQAYAVPLSPQKLFSGGIEFVGADNNNLSVEEKEKQTQSLLEAAKMAVIESRKSKTLPVMIKAIDVSPIPPHLLHDFGEVWPEIKGVKLIDSDPMRKLNIRAMGVSKKVAMNFGYGCTPFYLSLQNHRKLMPLTRNVWKLLYIRFRNAGYPRQVAKDFISKTIVKRGDKEYLTHMRLVHKHGIVNMDKYSPNDGKIYLAKADASWASINLVNARHANARLRKKRAEWALANKVNLLREYIVTLYENKDATGTIVFHCMAEDKQHAYEQIVSVYPGCVIMNYEPRPIYHNDAADDTRFALAP